ncbi:hypothetical protein ACIQXI_08175 [Lysinibacillus sp. NPDC097195]|uniref:hypothetical protein n=1 Tax=Lysinibacillus sp. NPDC097195 TaxID=3364141 RepID=UPI0038098B0F
MIETISINKLCTAQKQTNFVMLIPKLPATYAIDNITVRKESPTVRSSLRFEIKNKTGIIRIKQFFYDWAVPVITADTNLVAQGKSFQIDGIVGFLGTDYKGNQAVCFAKWFTTIELSVLQGVYQEEELLFILKRLEPIDPSSIESLGRQSFATSSFTSRYKKPKWDKEDEVTRVTWFNHDTALLKDSLTAFPIAPPAIVEEYFLDSIGFQTYSCGSELHLLYRSKTNYTDGFWLWVAPKALSDPLPKLTGHNIGKRQSWNIKKIQSNKKSCPIKEFIVCRQNTTYNGWRIHWEREHYIYHLYVRPSTEFTLSKLYNFLVLLHSKY